ncbi:PAP/fibrillin family protein [Lyngbya confervoides]|uniref:PAP/fibrillin family protein n=1 Tax=Lyngbya confervoides BDU141951 TaxID=1574623 RepID=A0ABD4T784_9CYAN|nr:PAP/fibrillin family protein [Lyngbya confervoides]MCM1984341.1 PAP/fibrillin family protein [Lyngbya confervoides BDU141951]
MLGKSELLEAIAGKNRGVLATAEDRVAILSAIAQLEDRNPTPRPVEALDLLDGDWRLLYTSSQGLLGFERIPLLRLGQVYQCIRAPEAKVYNLAEILGLPLLEGLISVEARFTAMTEKRVNVFFERTLIGLQRSMGYSGPALWIEALQAGKSPFAAKIDLNPERPPGWLDITYLDQELRIGRGNRGSVFVLTKVKSSTP